MPQPPSLLFVCLGNICRSPTAEGVMRSLAQREAIPLTLDSAGTGDWHVGHPPDRRAAAAAAARGIDISGLRARQVSVADFDRFDLLLAMDRSNQADLLALAPHDEARKKVRLFLGDRDVPDPYYGGPNGFEAVLDLVEDACLRLLDELRAAA